MEIRRARANDTWEIARIEEECFGDPWCEKELNSYVCSEDGMCYTALKDGRVIGYIIGRKILPEAEIYRIAVTPSERQRGVGYRLLSYALKCEGGEGVETVFLEVRSQNLPARALYLSYGFKEISVRKNYYKNPTDDATIMIYEASEKF